MDIHSVIPVHRISRVPRRKALLFGLATAGIAAACFLAAVPGGSTRVHSGGAEGTAMENGKGNGEAARHAAIPPIDLEAHGASETAVFALG